MLDVPQSSVDFAFGFLLAGGGKVWGADFELEKVGTAIPVTSRDPTLPRRPKNLDFEMTAPQTNAPSAQSGSFPTMAAGDGRVFIYEPSSVSSYPTAKIELNGKMVGTAVPGRFFFGDKPPGDYIVTALVPDASDSGYAGGHRFVHDAPATAHTVTLHLNAGQVRYVRLGVRSSPMFVTQVYPELVDETLGRAQIDKIQSTAQR